MVKQSFEPIIGHQPKVMILGSLPGEKSLELQQYYGFPQNRFWKLMFQIYQQEFSADYSTRLELIKANKLILWDVAHSAERIGSLDSAINNEVPNDLHRLIQKHRTIEKIIFNGKKAEQMYRRFFEPISNIQYYTNPSTSPANASYSFDRLLTIWTDSIFK